MGRLKHYCKIELQSVREEKIRSNDSPARILRLEGERLLSKIDRDTFLVVLDKAGKSLDSVEFSHQIEQWQNRGTRKVIFMIGGPLGIDETVKQRANLILSISRFTFTHEMVRLILLEQIYRAFTILRGEKYHK